MAAFGSNWWNDPTAPEQKAPENDLRDLYVFGYACKLFREDEKAKFIDEGKHLIPWMGDERLMIDRYDGRGHLFDLTKYDADLQKGHLVELSEEEQAVEAACDEERYLELHTNVQEKAMYEEEEWKRYYESLHSAGYNAVGFSYDQSGAADAQGDETPAEEDDTFVPIEQLQIPADMVMPETQKEHARIEKTASFIAQHGTQMEIMIKTKQARNSQFNFMNFEHPLNHYYQHLVKMIKEGKYKPEQEQKVQKEQEEQDHTDQHYLHPSLSTTTTATVLPPPPPPKPIVLPKISIHDTPYGQLVNSFKKYSRIEAKDDPDLAPPLLPPFMAQPDYGSSCPLLSLPSSASRDEGDGGEQQPPPPGTEVMDPLPRAHSAGNLQGHGSRIVPPPPDIQPIIDRMAMYVAKNGVEFEIVVKRKKDPRFAFLEPGHVHFKYYDFKKQMFMQGNGGSKKTEEEVKQAEETMQTLEETAAQANRSISFSIKGRNKEPESVNTLKRPLFDYDSSDGETEGEGSKDKGSNSPCSQPDDIQTLTATSIAKPPVATVGTVTVPGADTKSSIPPEELERRQAEERLKDKLATAARDKLATATREKQLQAERKRKAAMFINLLRIVKESPLEDGATAEGDAKRSPACSGPASPVVYEYNNRSGTPTRLDLDFKDRDKRRSESPSYTGYSHKKRRKKSPTPPSAYANPRRSPARYSPIRRRSRSPWRGPIASRRISPVRQWRRSPSPPQRSRERSPLRRQSRSPNRKRKSSKRSKSRSESPSGSKLKKKHKRSRSKTPKKKKKDKDRSRSKDKDVSSSTEKDTIGSKEKTRSRDKDQSGSRDRSPDRDKHKDRHKGKDKKKDRDRSREKKDRNKVKESPKDRDKKRDKDSGKHREKDKEKNKDSSQDAKSIDRRSREVSPEKSASKTDTASELSEDKVVHEISSSSSDSSPDSEDDVDGKDNNATSRTESQESCILTQKERSPVSSGDSQKNSDRTEKEVMIL